LIAGDNFKFGRVETMIRAYHLCFDESVSALRKTTLRRRILKQSVDPHWRQSSSKSLCTGVTGAGRFPGVGLVVIEMSISFSIQHFPFSIFPLSEIRKMEIPLWYLNYLPRFRVITVLWKMATN
jgi:hypothetical protein